MQVLYDRSDGTQRCVGRAAAQRLIDSGRAVRITTKRIRERGSIAHWPQRCAPGFVTNGVTVKRWLGGGGK